MSGHKAKVRVDLHGPEIHAQWESVYLNPDLDRLYDRIFERIVRILAPKPDQTLLDAGCGSCFHAARLAKAGLRVTALDFSDAALKRGAETIRLAGMADRIRVERGGRSRRHFSQRAFYYGHRSCGLMNGLP